MIALRPGSRLLARRLLLLPAVLLLFGLAAAALHHHSDDDGSHACPLCTLGHTPAVVADAAPALSPAQAAGCVGTPALATPCVRRGGPRACRAPPTL